MMRNALPRFFHKVSRLEKPTASAAKSAKTVDCSCPKRQYYKGRGPRDLPVNRRSFFDDFFHGTPMGFSGGGPGRLMAGNFRNMQRLMEEMAPPAFWRFPRGWFPAESMRPVATRGGAVGVKLNDHAFEVKVDVHEYAPEELDVKIAGDKLNISGKHQETPDEYGMVSREFSRQFLIPEEVEADTIESMLTNDGYLVITGKVKGSENVEQRNIKIEREPPKPAEGESKTEDIGKDK